VEPDSSRQAFQGNLLQVVVEQWPAGEREVVHHPGACAVVAFTPGGDVLLVRQRREAVRRDLLEIPAGIRDVEGEDVAACAARELLEETGYRVTSIEPLASIFTSPGFADERIDLFLAEAVPDREPSEDGVSAVVMSLEAALSAVRGGTIVDAKTVAGLLLAAERRGHPA
jgi:8-oxo-dGTP pyrophosphatase MutT (NUDIX family)